MAMKRETVKEVYDVLFYTLCGLVILVSEMTADGTWSQIIPPQYAHIFSIVGVLAAWFKARWNRFVNPDGTPAIVPWQPPAPPTSIGPINTPTRPTGRS